MRSQVPDMADFVDSSLPAAQESKSHLPVPFATRPSEIAISKGQGKARAQVGTAGSRGSWVSDMELTSS